MKKNLFVTFLLLTSTITVSSNIYASIQQSSAVVPAEVYQAIDDLDYDKLVSILTVTGPLSKEAKGLPILTLYKLRDEVIIDGSNLREKLLLDSQAFDIKVLGLISFGCLSLSVGTLSGLSALCLPDATLLNRVLLSGASLGFLALCSYVAYILAKKTHQKIADMNALIEPFNQKLDIIHSMIELIESHSG